MGLSYNKLEKIINNNNFIIDSVFSIKQFCTFLKLVNIFGDTFYIYIPSKYSIDVTHAKTNLFNIKEIEIEDLDIDDYIQDKDDLELQKDYNNIQIEQDITDFKKSLENSYDQQIKLKNVNDQNKLCLTQIFRQIRRLKLCLENTSYNILITFRNFICLNKDSFNRIFLINDNKYVFFDQYNLHIFMILDTFIDNITTVNNDITTLTEGISQILNKNQTKHSLKIAKMLEIQSKLSINSNKINKIKQEYDMFLIRLKNILNNILINEKKIMNDIKQLNQHRYKSNIHDDIQKSKNISLLQNKLMQIRQLKNDTIYKIIEIKKKYFNISLKTDKIMFDNSVMLDTIINNFQKLSCDNTL